MNNKESSLKPAYDLGWADFFQDSSFKNAYDIDSKDKNEMYKAFMYMMGYRHAAEYDGQIKIMED